MSKAPKVSVRLERSWLALLLLLVCAGTSSAQQGELRGRILNRANDRPVSGARVSVNSEGDVEFTDEAGQFKLDAPAGSRGDTLVIDHPDFVPTRIPLGDSRPEEWELTVLLLHNRLRVDRDR